MKFRKWWLVEAYWLILAVFFWSKHVGFRLGYLWVLLPSYWVPRIRSHLPTLISEICTKPTTWLWRWLDECNLLPIFTGVSWVYWATLKRIETTIIVKLVVIYVFPFLGMTIVPNMSNFLGPTLSRNKRNKSLHKNAGIKNAQGR